MVNTKDLNCEYFLDTWYRYLAEDDKKQCLNDPENTYTRAEVEQLSGKLYNYLKTQGIGTEDFVLIDLPRGSKIFIAMIAVAKAGAAYVVVESDFGKERKEYIQKNINSKLTINEETFTKLADVKYLRGYEDVDLHDSAFAIYTSGTTGTPKGVVHEYGNYCMLYNSIRDPKTGVLRENVDTRFLTIAPFNFIASVMIFALLLYAGGIVFTPDYATIKNNKRLLTYMFVHKITETFLPPSAIKRAGNLLNPEMKVVYTGSEPAHNLEIKHGELHNLYLMSEALFVLCQYPITKMEENIPVGKPNDGIEIKTTEEGEILVRNPYCRGYLDDVHNKAFKDGYYHTGDIAELDENGNYVIKGRNVDMIKVNGNRVEPMEVELVASKLLKGTPVAVKGFERADDAYICLYYEAKKDLDKKALVEKMKDYLPYYMIPSHFVRMDSLPKTRTGKLNKKLLLEPSKMGNIPYVAPRNDEEKKFCDAFQQALNVKEVGVTADLFDLGLNSLSAIDAISILDYDELQTSDVYRCRTIEELVKFYEEASHEFLTPEEKELASRKRMFPLNPNNSLFYYWQLMSNTSAQNLSFACKFNKLINIEKLRDAVNTYTDASSSFKMMLVADENGQILQKYSPELYHPVAVEYMTEEEVEDLRQNFVRPFKLLEELPYKIRVIKTKKASYLFVDVHHLISDGLGMTTMVNEISAAYKGEKLKINDYFAYCYDWQKLAESGRIEEHLEHVLKKFEGGTWGGQIEEPGEGVYSVNILRNTGISLKRLNKFLQENNTTRNALFMSATAIVLAKYNKCTNLRLTWQYGNREPNQNQAGYRQMSTMAAIRLDKKMSINDALEVAEAEIQDSIAYFCPAQLCKALGGPTACAIDDLGDMEEADKVLNLVGKRLELERPYDSIKGASLGYTNINFVNKKGDLNLRLVTDNNIINEEYREYLLNEVTSVLNRILDKDETLIPEYLNF